jgi:hypothetical protein
MADGKGGAYTGVPVAVSQASWVPTTPVPQSLQCQLASDDGGEDITISWKSIAPGERLSRIICSIIGCTWVFGGIGIFFVVIVGEVVDIGFVELALVFYPFLAVLVYGGLLLKGRDTIWPPRHTLTVTFEAVHYSLRSYSPECLSAIAAGIGGNGARTVTKTVSRVGLLRIRTEVPRDWQRHIYEYEIVLESADGDIMKLTLHDKKTRHWLHMLLRNWRNNSGGGSRRGGKPLALARLNGPPVLASTPPAMATVVLV